MRAWAEWLYDNRIVCGSTILLITIFFAWQLRYLEIATYFRDLYPINHPHTKLFEKYPKFGSPLTVSVLVQVKQGTIYNEDTLRKIQEATRLVDLIPGVDHDQILSIASRKVKHVEATIQGIQTTNLLLGPVPQTSEEIAKLRRRVRSTAGVMGTLVSSQEDAALIQATFIERLADYNVIFNGINEIIEKLEDHNHEVHAAGQPMLTGWVYHYQREMILIFAVTLVGMILLLVCHMRNLAGVATPIIVSATTAVWGFGIAAFFEVSIDPLVMVLPMLLVARSFSHAVQACERYFEIYVHSQNKREGCVGSLVSIFPPGTLGIVTDAAGLFFIAVAPIPIMSKVAFLCGFWALSLIPANVLFTTIVLSYLPPPRNAAQIVGRRDSEANATVLSRAVQLFDAAIGKLHFETGNVCQGKAAWGTVAVLVIVVVWSGIVATRLTVGDIHPGTPLLWPDSPYNTAVKRINERLAGFDVLQVVMEGDTFSAIQKPEALNLMQRFQKHMEHDPEVGGTFSFADMVAQVNRLFHGGMPKWNVIPTSVSDAAMFSQLAITGASPGDFDRLFAQDFSAGNITVWYKDHREKTIDRALTHGLRISLAAGTIGLLGAINEVVAQSELWILLLVLATVFVTCSITYRSFVAAVLLLIPVNISNLIGSAIMVYMNIGLDVNTLPVAAVGIGIGIDYGIYLMSRICEEYQIQRNYEEAISSAISTTGRAILFTASTLLVGMVPWYFLSNLRFQADMGLLIAFLMGINMIVALIVVPLLLFIIRPKFAAQVRYIVAGSGSSEREQDLLSESQTV
jgi:predicted RND superfamily exporter protein